MTENSASAAAGASEQHVAVAEEEPAPGPAPLSFSDPAFAARYGVKPGMSRARKITLGVVGFAMLCGVAGYIAWNQANPQIQGTVVSFTTTPDSITVTVEVDKSASQAVECTIQAMDVKGDVIGQANISVPAGRAKEDMLHTVNTTGTPNSASVVTCQATS